MAAFNTSGPAQLGADNVVRFADPAHFLRELAGNLGRGRAFVKSKRKFELQSSLAVRIEAPGVAWSVSAQALVVFVRDGFVGLELEEFEDKVLPKLDLLGEEAARNASETIESIGERTVIAPMKIPDFDTPMTSGHGSAVVEFNDAEEERTGHMHVPPSLRAGVRGGGSVAALENTQEDGGPPPLPTKPPPLRRAPAPIPDAATVHEPNATEAAREKAARSVRGRDSAKKIEKSERSQKIDREVLEKAERERAERERADRERADREREREERERAEKLEADREQLERERAERERADRDRAETIDAERAELTRDQAELEREQAELEREQAELEREQAELEREQTELERHQANLERGRADLEREHADLEREQTELERHHADIDKARAEIERERTELENARAQLEKDRAEAEAQNVALERAETPLISELGPPVLVPIPELPSITAFGLDVLEAKTMPLLRSTGAGVVRANDPAILLGAYLSQLRHNFVTLYGGPEGELGAKVKLKLAAGRVLTLDAEIAARIGDWVTLNVPDVSLVAEQLLEQSAQLYELLVPVLGNTSAGEPAPNEEEDPDFQEETRDEILPTLPAMARPEKPAPAELSIAPEPPAIEPLPADAIAANWNLEPEDEPGPDLPPPQRTATPTAPPPAASVAPIPAPTAAPLVEDDGPPRPPKLTGDVVVFARIKDLRHEIDANVKNGGLFVESAPLALRTHKSLKFQVGDKPLNAKIEADVVFAAGGRVGFSIGAPAESRASLERAIEALLNPNAVSPVDKDRTTNPPPAATVDIGAAPIEKIPEPSVEIDQGLVPFTARLGRVPSFGEIIDLQSRRTKSAADLSGSSVLFAFEWVMRMNGRGVLTIRGADKKETIYMHEGSVAFIESHPFDEDLSLGRMLIAGKKITEPALREGLERARSSRRALGRTLVALGSITKKVLAEMLREQTRAKLEAAFHWKEGGVEWSAWREPPGDADLVLTKGIGIIARHIKSRFETLSSTELETMFGKNMNRVVVLTPNTESMVEAVGSTIGLGQKELRFIELAGERTISDVITGSPFGRLASLRMIAVGLALGIFIFRDGRVGTFVGLVRPKSEVADSPEQTQLRRELRERLGLMKGMNHFEVLGVHWSVHYRAYRMAYEKLKRELDLSRGILRDAAPDTIELAKELIKILDKAYTTLSDERQRLAYRNQFFDKTERQYSADMLVKQGEVALMRNDRVGAIEALETAVELDPSARNRQLLAGAREGKSV